ncbi:GNAT family N-acetyltransferase [Gemmatimonas sp.]|uniref:GNAT family N-acetyltransferase n=1 Tax=Gemmatimonas sp. TaxID=1962908 RepID=UPI00286E80C7|nr:GNAT family N-acetyltransferase [Gemmatimonas sp.]
MIPSSAVVIRTATKADLPALGRLAVLLVRLHHDFDRARFMAATDQTERGYGSYLGSQLAERDTTVLVATVEETVVGYAWGSLEGIDYMSLRGPAGVLHDLVVDEAHRRRGIGSLLLEAAIASLETAGARQVVLSTAARNENAQQLFTRHGFRATMLELTRDMEHHESERRGEA